MKVITKLPIRIMEEISKDLTRFWTINELAKCIGKFYRPVYAAVNKLINKKILGKNSNGLIEPLFSETIFLELSEKSRFSKLRNKEIVIIKERLEKIDNPFFIAVLFGSAVYKKGKDIDILIIIPDEAILEDFEKEIRDALGSFYSKVDLNIVSKKSCYEMLNKPNELNVMNEVMKNHLVLIGAESFYKIIRTWKNA